MTPVMRTETCLDARHATQLSGKPPRDFASRRAEHGGMHARGASGSSRKPLIAPAPAAEDKAAAGVRAASTAVSRRPAASTYRPRRRAPTRRFTCASECCNARAQFPRGWGCHHTSRRAPALRTLACGLWIKARCAAARRRPPACPGLQGRFDGVAQSRRVRSTGAPRPPAASSGSGQRDRRASLRRAAWTRTSACGFSSACVRASARPRSPAPQVRRGEPRDRHR